VGLLFSPILYRHQLRLASEDVGRKEAAIGRLENDILEMNEKTAEDKGMFSLPFPLLSPSCHLLLLPSPPSPLPPPPPSLSPAPYSRGGSRGFFYCSKILKNQ
jgi:hypothetical protein